NTVTAKVIHTELEDTPTVTIGTGLTGPRVGKTSRRHRRRSRVRRVHQKRAVVAHDGSTRAVISHSVSDTHTVNLEQRGECLHIDKCCTVRRLTVLHAVNDIRVIDKNVEGLTANNKLVRTEAGATLHLTRSRADIFNRRRSRIIPTKELTR